MNAIEKERLNVVRNEKGGLDMSISAYPAAFRHIPDSTVFINSITGEKDTFKDIIVFQDGKDFYIYPKEYADIRKKLKNYRMENWSIEKDATIKLNDNKKVAPVDIRDKYVPSSKATTANTEENNHKLEKRLQEVEREISNIKFFINSVEKIMKEDKSINAINIEEMKKEIKEIATALDENIRTTNDLYTVIDRINNLSTRASSMNLGNVRSNGYGTLFQ